MARTLGERIVGAIPYLDELSDALQPVVQEAVGKGGVGIRNVLDGTLIETPLHPALTDVPVGAWTAALIFDGLDVVGRPRGVRSAADWSLAVGTAGGVMAAVTGLSDWRDLRGSSRRMGMAHGLLNTAGLALSAASLGLRAAGKRGAGRWVFLLGYSLAGTATHLGGELSYNYGLRVNRAVFYEGSGPQEFTAVLRVEELPVSGVVGAEVGGSKIVLARTGGGEICAVSALCTHMSGALDQGQREGDTVICPLHGSRFDLCSGAPIDGPALYPVVRYETRIRGGNVEVRQAAD